MIEKNVVISKRAIGLLGGLLLSSPALAETKAEPKIPFRNVLVLGGGYPLDGIISNGEGTWVPVFRYIRYQEPQESNWDILAKIDSLGASVQLDYFTGQSTPGVGVKPYLNYVSHANYRDYEADGSRDQTAENLGHEAGLEIFSGYSLSDDLTARLSYAFERKFYQATDNTATLPDDHFGNNLILDVSYKDINEDKVMAVKDGVRLRFQGTYENRPSYDDSNPATDNNNYTLKALLQASANWKLGDLNLQLDGSAGIEEGADKQNAWYIGSFLTSEASAPGHYYREFRRSPFLKARLGLGLPLTQNNRVTPEVSALYFPGTNRIEGGDTYPEDVYPSVGLTFNGKIMGILPYRLSYGYSPLATRVGKQGGHELLGYLVAAWDKTGE